ncbi:spike protein [Guangdong red-banded snake torovirus]|uniref:Spike protein n=1 Tax=Guangdong red-banded snake-Lycodon rufozonatus-torovirus LPSF30546 TaxID=2847099 RepID=A0A2P1GMX0_9NIDO|nr:spike protein [Guangdong red-banded snake torovirus]AVM87347.1 spike protein [Guangdong red-banded snake-Lycodon rufozonatus-torovirus LPSF30546]
MNILILACFVPTLAYYEDWDKSILAINATDYINSISKLGTLLQNPHPVDHVNLPVKLDVLQEMLQKYNLYGKKQAIHTYQGSTLKYYNTYPGSVSVVHSSTNISQVSITRGRISLAVACNASIVKIDNIHYLDPRQHLAIRTFRNKSNPSYTCKDYNKVNYTTRKSSSKSYAVDLTTGYSIELQRLNIPQNYTNNSCYDDYKRFECASVMCNETLIAGKNKNKEYDFKVFRCFLKTDNQNYKRITVKADKKVETIRHTCHSPTGCITIIDAKPILTIIDNVIVDAPKTATDINYLRQVSLGYAAQMSNHVWYCPKWSLPFYLDFIYKSKTKEQYDACGYRVIQSTYKQFSNGDVEPSSSNLKYYFFTSQFEMYYFSPLGLLTVPFVYSAAPKQHKPLIVSFGTPLSINYVPPAVVVRSGQKFVDFGQVNGTQLYGPDPQFVSGTTTLLPTKGSCQYKSGYFFRGSFEVVPKQGIPLCGPADHLPMLKTCYSSKLQPDRITVFAQKRLWMPPVSCITLCENPLKCTNQETVSPYYQACVLIATQINELTGNKGAPLGLPVDSSLSSYLFNATKYVNFTQEVVKVQEISAIKPLNNALKKIDILRQRLRPLRGGGPVSVDPSFFLDIWSEGQYNAPSDMNWVAAFPWLSGWRFGRQINTLNYAMVAVVDALTDYVPKLNKNFQYISAVLSSVSTQATTNYKSITQLYNNFKSSYSDLTKEINNIKLQLARDQYMAAKVATLNNLYTQVVSAKATIETDIKLFAIKRDQCRGRAFGCTGNAGTYLFHSEIETEDYLQLIISYLRPVNCSFLYQTSSFCLYNVLYVPPFPCIIQSKDIPNQPSDLQYINMTDGKECQLEVLKISGCDQTPEFTDAVKFVNLFDSQIIRPNVSITNLQFNEKIGNITGFFQGVKSLVSGIEFLKDPSQYFNDTVNRYYDAIFSNSNDWSFLDYLKVALVALLILLLLPIIIPIVQSCFSCCRR